MVIITGGRLSVMGDWVCNHVKKFYSYKIFLYLGGGEGWHREKRGYVLWLFCLDFLFHHYNTNIFDLFLAVRAGDFLTDDFDFHSTFQISKSQSVSRWGLDGNVFIEFIDLAIDFIGAGLRRRVTDNSLDFDGFWAICMRKVGDE